MTAKLGNQFKQATKVGGVWQVVFNASDLGITVADYECYRIVISGGPAGSTFTIMVNNNLWDAVFPGDTNSWDPNNPMPLNQGDNLTFTWNLGTGTTGPTVWLYFQETKIL